MTAFLAAFIAAIVAGAVIGILSGMLGIGGGSIIIPVLRLMVGLSPIQCTATSLLTIIVISLGGSVSRLRNKTSIPQLSVAIGAGGALCSPVGVWLASCSPDIAVMCACAACLMYSAVTIVRSAIHPKTEEEALVVPELNRRDYVKGFFFGMLVGVASGYVGLGGGFLIMPFLLQFMHLSMKLASGTSLLAVMITVIPAAVMQLYLGNVEIWVVAALSIGAIPGAFFGGKLAARAPERVLSIGLGIILIIAAAGLVLREFI